MDTFTQKSSSRASIYSNFENPVVGAPGGLMDEARKVVDKVK